MQHLTEEQLIAHYYHDGDAADADHLDTCDECRSQFETLRDVLALVDQLPVPERSAAYGEEVWTRLRWKLGSERRRSRVWSTIAAIAAALAIAFIGGALWHARTQRLEHLGTLVAHAAQHGPNQPAAIESAFAGAGASTMRGVSLRSSTSFRVTDLRNTELAAF